MEVAELLERTRPLALAGTRALPVAPGLAPLLPAGLRRGSTVALGAVPGRTSLLLALLAGASGAGSWCAVVGMPRLGAEAAAAAGVDLGRLALVPDPGDRWATVVSALLDGVDLVAVGLERPPRAADARRLSARARHNSAVLVVVGGAWPEAPDLSLRVVRASWEGLGRGYGHLRRRRLEVEVTGRRGEGRPRRAALWLPSDSGPVEPDDLIPLRRPG